jgi:hypothetical protein
MGPLIGSGNVLKELEGVFCHPNSKAYATAQSKKYLFQGIGVGVGNWQDLVAAYKAVGLAVSPPWESYLSNLDPANIYAIAQARFDGLTRGVAMKVKTHPSGGANKVIVTTEANGSILISSPF